MFELAFLITFTVALIIANVYCFIKKKYLYLFFPCMLFLPNYYGIEITDRLPLLTASRMMLAVFFIYSYINRKRSINLSSLQILKTQKEYWLLAGYFVLRIASNLYYATTYLQAAKTIFLIVVEQLFLLLAIYLIAPTKDEIIILIKAIVWTAAALFAIGIIESVTGVRPFDSLYTVTRELYNLYYYRLGLLRATTTMYAPAIYGNMCILVMPLILFLYNCERAKKYLVIAGFDVLAIIHSGSRSDYFFLVFIFLFYLIFVLKEKSRRLLCIKNCGSIIAILLLFISIFSALSPNLKYFYVGSAKSVLNEIGFDFDLDKDAPNGVKGYGSNRSGSVSRIRQFTGIYYVAKRNPLFGMGSAAILRGDVQFYWHTDEGYDGWVRATAYDVGAVEIFCDEGLLGILGMCSLLIYMAIKSKWSDYYKMLLLAYILATLSTGNMISFLMLYVGLAFGLSSTDDIVSSINRGVKEHNLLGRINDGREKV